MSHSSPSSTASKANDRVTHIARKIGLLTLNKIKRYLCTLIRYNDFTNFKLSNMSEITKCPKCGGEYVYFDGSLYVCPDCAYEFDGESALLQQATRHHVIATAQSSWMAMQ